jgi:ribosomal protein S18 acetylase RimI-like enzyme
MKIRAFDPADEVAVVALWEAAGLTRPWNDPHKDIARKLTTQPELFLIGELAGRVIASAMIGFDGHRGWIYYLAVSPDQRGNGFAGLLIAEGERLLTERGCPKLMLMVRADNSSVIDLYERVGYETETTIVMGKRLIPDN